VIGDAEDGGRELLDDQHGHALPGDLGHLLVEPGDDQRGQAHGQLVQQQHSGVRGQAPGQGEHLLLAAGQGSGRPGGIPGEDGEPAERELLDLLAAVAGERHHQEVVADRQVGEHAASFGDQADPRAGQVARGDPGHVPAAEH
jgi:hypothetical protein